MSEREAFLKALAENPDDVATRLVFADWLDEQGEHEEGDRQRKWVAAREWLVKFCHDNNPPPEEQDDSYISYERLMTLARVAIKSGNQAGLWYEVRNNHTLWKALRNNEKEFWKNAALVTGATPPAPASGGYDSGWDGVCPGGGSGC